jgi:poly-gamma-glutamate capsule biosynthesis protein CapA/YwtB (metallophosphatase superfamily)
MRDTRSMSEPAPPAGSPRTRGRFMIVAGVVGAVAVAAVSFAAASQIPALSTVAAQVPPTVTIEAVPPSAPARVAVEQPAIRPVAFTLVAAGDVLPHGPVVSSATTSAGYDFTPLMAGVQPYVAGADLALCHMEVPVVPPGVAPSGYPLFGSPPEMVRDLAATGWDGCSTASNHSVDRKFAGVASTLDTMDSYGMGHTGTARSAEESASVQMYDVSEGARTVKVAHISYAYGLNGLPKPAGMPWSVNTFDADAADATPIIAAAQAARDQGADVVLASVHCCVEYRTEPTPAQRLLAEKIAASGLVDLYIGHHAHVPQPIEKLPGGPYGDGMWTAFGLGNFLSNQHPDCCTVNSTTGVLLTATFDVDVDATVTVSVEWTAATVDRGDRHAMHVLTDVPGGVGSLSSAEVAARHQRVADAVGGQAPERTSPAVSLSDGVVTQSRMGTIATAARIDAPAS